MFFWVKLLVPYKINVAVRVLKPLPFCLGVLGYQRVEHEGPGMGVIVSGSREDLGCGLQPTASLTSAYGVMVDNLDLLAGLVPVEFACIVH